MSRRSSLVGSIGAVTLFVGVATFVASSRFLVTSRDRSLLEPLAMLAKRLSETAARQEAALADQRAEVLALRARLDAVKAPDKTPDKTPESDGPPFVFVAGIEGTGHHWYKAVFEACGRPCAPTKVGPLSWQRSAAVFASKMDAHHVARTEAVKAARADLAKDGVAFFALNTLGGLNDAAMADVKRSADLPWTQGEGMLSYPNWWSSPNKALQMPDVLAMSDAIQEAATPSRTPQLRVALTTRDSASIVNSVCKKRNFAKDAGGCATEVAMLVLGAAALAAQIMALPPPPAAVCRHFRFGDLQAADANALKTLGSFLRLDDTLPSLAKRANSHASSSRSQPQRGSAITGFVFCLLLSYLSSQARRSRVRPRSRAADARPRLRVPRLVSSAD